MANMSSQDIQPSMAMLILSRAIYAKKSDDAFYPGTIETKLADGSYLVKFTDGASERVEEHAITWLGFWGLPPWTWPRNPVVQTAGPANMDFLNEHGNKDAISDSLPFKTLFRESNDNSKRVNGFSEMDIKSNVPYRTEKMNQHTHELNSFEQSSAHVLPRQTSENQTRLSVLRMCCDGNLKQEHFNGEKDLLAPAEHKLESPAFRPSPHSTSPKNEDKKQFTFDEDYKTLKIKNDSSFRKRRVSSSEYEECSIKDKYTRSEDIENKHRNSPPFQKHYPTTLPPLLSPHFQNYGHPFGISMYDSPSPPMPASFRLQPRERRRSENKKCRKVYGIENRDIWCTQCKWKKACTRFTGTEKVDRPGLMYMTDYEGLHYPV